MKRARERGAALLMAMLTVAFVAHGATETPIDEMSSLPTSRL